MIIRKARPAEYRNVRAFYHAVIDGIAGEQNSAGWKKDIYPTPEYLKDSINRGDLYIGFEDDTMIASMVLDHHANDGYREFRWPTAAADDEVTVIHILGILPSCMGKGYAKQMVRFAADHARDNDQKVIRIDVLKGNIRAEKLYAAMGFDYLHTLPMYYEDTGWTDFELYELPL